MSSYRKKNMVDALKHPRAGIWTRHTEDHWQVMVAGFRVDYWPSIRKWRSSEFGHTMTDNDPYSYIDKVLAQFVPEPTCDFCGDDLGPVGSQHELMSRFLEVDCPNRWFAWYPVWTSKHFIWLKWCIRKQKGFGRGSGASTWYEYSLPKKKKASRPPPDRQGESL